VLILTFPTLKVEVLATTLLLNDIADEFASTTSPRPSLIVKDAFVRTLLTVLLPILTVLLDIVTLVPTNNVFDILTVLLSSLNVNALSPVNIPLLLKTI
jgi:hypothetical protein